MISTPHSPATTHAPPARAAQHEAERRRHMAASACRPLQQTLAQASQALFQSLVRIDELATQAQDHPDTRDNAANLRAVQDRMNDALQHGDQIATMVEHLQRLLEPAALAPRPFDLRTLLSRAVYCAHGLLPVGLVVTHHVAALPPVQGDRAEIMRALIDALVQVGACVHTGGRLELHGDSGAGMVWIELRVSGAGVPARPGLALESAIETLARHRGALELLPLGDDAFALRLRLPAAR